MSNKKVWRLPLLLLLALLLILAMLRLGVWQLSKASEKQSILDSRLLASQQASVSVESLGKLNESQRFTPVFARGRYLSSKTLYLDNQVFNKQVGYQVITPFVLESTGALILVTRGWVPAGASRDQLPNVASPKGVQRLEGRLNLPAAAPPLWDDKYSVYEGARWQYLDMQELDARYEAALHSLVLELHPDYEGDADLMRAWNDINDQWVAKHNAYALQWFSMAAAFFIACLILLLRRSKNER